MNEHQRPWYWLTFEIRRTAIGILLLVLCGYTLWQSGRVIECQKNFNVTFAQNLKERSDAAAGERQAQREMLDAILDPAGSNASRSAALVAWRAALDAADRKRDAYPLPEDPRCD